MLNLLGLLADDLLLPLDQLQHLPAYFLAVFVVALEIRTDVGDDLRGFVLLNQTNDCEDVQNLRDEVLEVKVFLLVHKGLHNIFNAALCHHIFLVNQRVKYL